MYTMLSSADENMMCCLACVVLPLGKDVWSTQVTSENLTFFSTFKLSHRCEIKLSSAWINRLMKTCVALRVPCYSYLQSTPPAAKAPVAARFGLERAGST